MSSLVFNIRPAAASDIRNLSAHDLHRAPDGNSAIDPERSHLNRVVLGPRTQSEALEALFASGVQRPAAQSEAPYVQIVLGASAGFFRPDDPEAIGTFQPERVAQFERAAMGWLRKTFGDDLIHASTHLDESTPHMHVLVAPTYQKAARKPGRKKRGETDAAFEDRKREAAERPTLRTVGRRSNALLSAPNSFQHLRQSLADHLAPLGIRYGEDLHPTDPDPQTTRQKLKRENDQLRALRDDEEERVKEAREVAAGALQAAQEAERRAGNYHRREEALREREIELEDQKAELTAQKECIAVAASNLGVAVSMAVTGRHDKEITASDMPGQRVDFGVLCRHAPEGRPTWGWRARFSALHYSDGWSIPEWDLPLKIRNALTVAFDRVADWAREIADQARRLTLREEEVARKEQEASGIVADARAHAAGIVRQAHKDAASYSGLVEALEQFRQVSEPMRQLALNFEALQEVTQAALRRLGVADKQIDLFGDYGDKDPPPVLELVMEKANRRAHEKVATLAARLRSSPGPRM